MNFWILGNLQKLSLLAQVYTVCHNNHRSTSLSYWVSVCVCISLTDTMVCTGCCATLDTVITYLFKNLTIKKKKRNHMQQNEAFLRILELHPEILQQVNIPLHFNQFDVLLQTIVNQLLFTTTIFCDFWRWTISQQPIFVIKV